VAVLVVASPCVALGQAQFLEVLAPAGGEVIHQVSTFEIRWISGGFTGPVGIEFSSTGPGGYFEVLAYSEPNDGSLDWYVDPSLYDISSDYVIRVTSEVEPPIYAASGVFEVTGPNPCGDCWPDVAGGEGCDDCNTTPGDGCDASCQIEPGWVCEFGLPSVCTELPAPVPSISSGGLALLGGLVFAIALGGLAVQRRRRAG